MADARGTLADWLRLTLVPGIGGRTQRKLLTAFGLPDVIFSAGHGALRAVIGDKAARRLLDADSTAAIAAALAWAQVPGQHIVTLADSAYPRALLEIADPPTLLYVIGQVEWLNQPMILSIVGSRMPTPQGILNAEQFARALAETGLVIASGMALGIDAAAHRGALAAHGKTIAFVGTGIDRVYPASNRELAHEIGARGVIVSEFPLGTPAAASNFPRRNRLISGVARGVLIVEATVESGSLITARLAGEQGREVFAIPGSIHSPQARGCHRLIKEGAKLVETAQDILEELHWSTPASEPTPIPASLPVSSAPFGAGGEDADGREKILSLMGYDPCGLDELAVRSGLSADVLSVHLLHLELEGRVASLPGGRYQQVKSEPEPGS
ncbi:MAG: DNA-processing protein DprA [Candidatus Accumulibacter sp.]|jgi:DNA processing protein|nr:DNA-processing protein DprA [Accumulibacter sp.]